jgi:murein DD-endopeptidase MepM/ murein hydrolase activator NlpD
MPQSAAAVSQSELRRELDSLQSEAQRVGRAYDRAYAALDVSGGRLSATNRKIAKTNKKLRAARRRLNRRAANIYRGNSVAMIDVVLGASSFEELVTRLSYLQRIGTSDAEAIAEVERLSAELIAQKAELVANKKTDAKALAKWKHERDKLQDRLASMRKRYGALQGQLDRIRSGGHLPSGVIAAPGPSGMVFPVRGPHYYSNTFGAPRSGGRRHKGTDIMSPSGTPCVAVLSGTVRTRENRLGGHTIYLNADNGWEFYYAHLSSYAVRGGRVKAGQVIGYVGSSGNASRSAPHLHFEVHIHGTAVNPYPYLRGME